MALSSPILAAETDPFLDLERSSPLSSPGRRIRTTLRAAALPLRILRPHALQWLLPSFLHRRHGSEPSHPSSTEWLDGMRGLASFFVYVRHFASATHPNIQAGYGSTSGNRWIIQLPILHLVTSGPAMVALFFIISGYALSYSPLKALHQHDSPEACLMRLSSATFRRFARLFLPSIVSTFLVAVCISFGLYGRGHTMYTSRDMPGFWEPEPPQWRNDPWHYQFQNWAYDTWNFLNMWSPGGHPYDVHLWTLPVEFRCSIILFICLVGFARCAARLRAAMLFGMLLYIYYTNEWQNWLFFAGSFLCQLRLLQDDTAGAPSLTLDTTEETEKEEEVYDISWPDISRLFLFLTGLYLLSAPDYGWASSAPGYINLTAKLTPASWPENWRFLHCLGGILVVYSTSSTSTPMLRSLFTLSPVRYLGSISYALYLVHGPITHMLGFWLVPWFWSNMTGGPETGMWGKEVGFLCGFVVQTAVVVWVADLFWRGVDTNCVRFAKWIEGRVVVGSGRR